MPLTRETLTIQDALNRPEIMQGLQAQLQSEFSTENLDFYRATKRFQERSQDPTVSVATLRSEAAGIYQQYVRENAPNQVNVSFQQVGEVNRSMAQLGGMTKDQMAGMFDVSQGEIVKLMTSDSFARFQRTQRCSEVVAKANELDRLTKDLADKQARLDRLRTDPSTLDKAQAVFTRGGMDKMIETAQQELQQAQQRLTAVQATVPQMPQVVLPTAAVPAPVVGQGVPQAPPQPVGIGGPAPVVGQGVPQAPPQPMGIGGPGPGVVQELEEVDGQEVGEEIAEDQNLAAEVAEEIEQEQVLEVENDIEVEIGEVEIGQGRERSQRVEGAGPQVQGPEEEQVEAADIGEDVAQDHEVGEGVKEENDIEVEIGEVEIGQGRERSRAPSVREMLGKGGPQKQGVQGPAVKGPKTGGMGH